MHSRQRAEIIPIREVSVAQSAEVVGNLAKSYTPENLLAKVGYFGDKEMKASQWSRNQRSKDTIPGMPPQCQSGFSLKFADVLG